jgi:hypothetical protein
MYFDHLAVFLPLQNLRSNISSVKGAKMDEVRRGEKGDEKGGEKGGEKGDGEGG